jgi:PhzF family phenazine biosynthesis protein
MGQRITQVDAFTDRPFGGNPAAVCILERAADESWMQAVAREMNLSETAFLHREGEGYALRWFTPTVEVALCGHATLAAAHVLWEEGRLAADEPARFVSRSGPLTASQNGDQIELDFPAKPAEPCEVPAGLDEALGARVVYAGRNGMDMLVEVATADELIGMRPDFGRLAEVPVRGVIVTARSADAAFDFLSRFFAPRAGVPEDPVTGSAHCCLGPFWAERLGKTDMVGHQVSERGGVVGVRLRGSRLGLLGRAVTVLRGELLFLPAR